MSWKCIHWFDLRACPKRNTV